MTNQNKTDIGLIGLAVMGENLALNMESKGWNVSVYNRTVPGVEEGVVDRFMNGRAKGKNIEGFTDIKDFVDSIATPRKIPTVVSNWPSRKVFFSSAAVCLVVKREL